ncbi:MAG: 4Fe-4S binding protein [Euryarchaeota archaeon]|nr:4Fe-4S binding protein [Euryarchaeota archaeon]
MEKRETILEIIKNFAGIERAVKPIIDVKKELITTQNELSKLILSLESFKAGYASEFNSLLIKELVKKIKAPEILDILKTFAEKEKLQELIDIVVSIKQEKEREKEKAIETTKKVNVLVKKFSDYISSASFDELSKKMKEIYDLINYPRVLTVSAVFQKLHREKKISDQKFRELFKDEILLQLERGSILFALDRIGHMTSIKVFETTGILPDKAYKHLCVLKRENKIQIISEENGHEVFAAVKALSPEEASLKQICLKAIVIGEEILNLKTRSANLNVEVIGEVLRSIDNIQSQLTELSQTTIAGVILSKNAIEKTLLDVKQLRAHLGGFIEKIPTKPRVSIETLKAFEVPEGLEGYGLVKWEFEKCIGCRICIDVCPHKALNFNTLLPLSEAIAAVEKFPEDKKLKKKALFFDMIKKLAVKIPTEPIKFPEIAFGYGKVEYDLLKCLACKNCEQSCPLDAIKVMPIFDLPSLMVPSKK